MFMRIKHMYVLISHTHTLSSCEVQFSHKTLLSVFVIKAEVILEIIWENPPNWKNDEPET